MLTVPKMVVPAIPQRPARSQNIDIPSIPPRPRRSKERSTSPGRDSYAPSPLNDPAFIPPPAGKSFGPSSLSRSVPRDVMQRPPSVNLPSVGQEGSEYAGLHEPDAGAAEQTKTIPGELPLHAPKASLPASTAKSRIAAVTRTDSNSAAALGIGKPSSEAGEVHHGHSHLAHEISRSSSAQQPSRPSSIYKGDVEPEEQGIPQIGQKSMLIPHAGDVQAPTPSLSGSVQTGSAFPPPQAESRNHSRTKSGRESFRGPPGSYGLHGHGITKSTDPLEKTWYEKHPEALAREVEGEYGPRIPMERKAYNLSSAQLNRIVHTPDNANHGFVGTPDEEIGYLASEEYTQRLASPRPPSAGKRRSLQYAESPLRKLSFPESQKPRLLKADVSDDDEVIHVDPSASHHISEVVPSSMDGAEDAEVFGQPILAADEVAKRPEGQYMTPAVDLDEARHGDFLGESLSRSHSRSNSVQHPASPLIQRITSASEHESTHLEDVKEYEPLFPEDEDTKSRTKKAPSEAGEPRHHFPSKDVWEDTPDSLRYETTVQTPQIPEFSRPEAEHEPSEIFEGEEAKTAPKPTAISREDVKPKQNFGRDVRSEMGRPLMRHRFPSQDVWEDAPDSHMHTTTITPDQDSPHAPPPAKEGSPTDGKDSSISDRPKPQVPARPSKPTKQESSEKVPTASQEEELTFPKSKPPVPARPAGSKISALRGAFMTNLESRLKAGPQDVPKPAEKEEEAEEEKAPLADARKGRARGPARRRPGQSPSGGSGSVPKSTPKVSFMSAVTIWEIDEDGSVSVPTKTKSTATEKTEEAAQ